MASPATINSWLDDLASAITAHSPVHIRNQKTVASSFKKRVKIHAFGRTDQFQVASNLTGLEEKFQINNQDALSDALYQRRMELKDHEQQWIPDVLDLLLRLSDDPLAGTRIENLYLIEPPASPQAPLKWVDIERDDPINRNDRLWKIPSFDASSSDEDEYQGGDSSTSSSSVKSDPAARSNNSLAHESRLFLKDGIPALQILPVSDMTTPSDTGVKTITELQAVRECLFMFQGMPTTLFYSTLQGLKPSLHFQIRDVDPGIFRKLLSRGLHIRRASDVVENWKEQKTNVNYLQVIQHKSNVVLDSFHQFLSLLARSILQPSSTCVVSLLRIIEETELAALHLNTLSRYLELVSTVEPVSCMERLFEQIEMCQLSGQEEESKLLIEVFLASFEKYLNPLWKWIEHGKLDETKSSWFIKSHLHAIDRRDLWSQWYRMEYSGLDRPPSFLGKVAENVFACGKTAAFIQLLDPSISESVDVTYSLEGLIGHAKQLIETIDVPFTEAFHALLSSHITSKLEKHTHLLKKLLENNCGMSATLDAFEYFYFHKNGAVLDQFENKIFSRIDRCIETWNDRFLVADMVRESFAQDLPSLDTRSVLVRSVYTSSRSMESRRQSVKILESLAIGYLLPWPVANIISTSSLAVYGRIALGLTQIRRVKYALEKVAFSRLRSAPISDDATSLEQSMAQAFNNTLLLFANTLYDHFTSSVILPMTQYMRTQLVGGEAVTMDDMIGIHKSYTKRIQHATLVSPKLKVLRDAMVALLDMCLRFSDLVSAPNSLQKGSADIEVNSFISAQSQRRRKQQRERMGENYDSEDDVDEGEADERDHGDGYSSFVVLEEDTNVVHEIRKLQTSFIRQLDFFIAGLRGVGRGSSNSTNAEGSSIEEFEMLAARLDWRGSIGP